MSPPKKRVFDPDAGGVKIPDPVKHDVEKRITSIAKKHFRGKCTRLDIRFKGQFCYIDAYQEPEVSNDWPPDDWQETKEEYIDRLRNTPIHLCRLRYFSKDRWSFSFYTYSNGKYELSIYPDGDFFGKPENAFLASAMYLQ